jgi:hypothetical protein
MRPLRWPRILPAKQRSPKEKEMRGYHFMLSGPALAAGLVLSSPTMATDGGGQSLAESLVGTWSLVSLEVHQEHNRGAVFGTEPRGIQIMAPNGRFAVITTRSELPRYASGNRILGTDAEYRAIGQGSNATYGRYTVDEEAGTVTFHVEVSTFPNWEGQDQVRAFRLEGDEWRYVNPSPTVGEGTVHVRWKRLD